MYPITNAVKALFDADNAQVLRITGTDRNGAVISITDADVLQGGFTIDRYCCNGDKLEVGTAVAAAMTLRLKNSDGRFDNTLFEGTELLVEVGIADWSQSNPTITYVPCGFFTSDEQPRRLNQINLTCLDRMTKFDRKAKAEELEFPTTVAALVGRICTLCGVTVAQTIVDYPNADLVVASMPTVTGGYTYRNLIQWCAGIMATNAWFDWNGDLRFTWYDGITNYSTTTANRYSSDLYENDLTITGAVYTNSSGTEMVAGLDDYAIDLTGNAIIGPLLASALPTIHAAVNQYTYRPFTASVVSAPYLWPMDVIDFVDKDGGHHTSVLTNVGFGLNVWTGLESRGMTYAANAKKQSAGVTKEQAQIINEVSQTVNILDRSLTQEEIFNRLTDGGQIQGLLLNNGKVYLNADYINSGTVKAENIDATNLHVAAANIDGTLNANQLRTGTITGQNGTSFWNLDTGELVIGGMSAADIAENVGESVIGVDTEFAQSQSSSTAPTSGWSTTAPSWAAGWYIWQRTKTTTPNGVEYGDPVCISGRDGSGSQPGLNQATLYLYQRSVTQPAKPSVQMTYTFADGSLTGIPAGWTRTIPAGSETCWVTSAAAISSDTAVTLAANAWQDAVAMAQSGATVAHMVSYFATNNSTTAPATEDFFALGQIMPLSDHNGNALRDHLGNVIGVAFTEAPTPTQDKPYVWCFQRSTYTDGSVLDSTKAIISVLAEPGVGVEDIVEEYYLSTSASAPTGGSWSTTQPEWREGRYIWTRTRVLWTDGETTYSTPILAAALNAANEAAAAAAAAAASANAREQTIYRTGASAANPPEATTTWVTNTGYTPNTWTTVRPAYDSTTPVLFVATQRQTVEQRSGTTCSCTTPVVDQTTTVIDGGSITTGTINAGLVDVTNIKAGNITSGTLNADRIGANTIAVSKLTGNISNGQWNIDLDNGTFTIGNISANNISGGNITANYIKGGTLTLGGANNQNGSLVLKDSDNTTTIGSWTQAGLSATKGTINGTSMILGGSNDGTLTVKDASGNTIGSWTKDGIVLNKGSIDASKVTVSNISASNITSGTLNANRIAGNTITSDMLTSGVRGQIANGEAAYARDTAYNGTCSTDASTVAKTVTCDGFTLATGATITVRFSNANTSTGALTLNVNSKGAKSICVNDTVVNSTNQLLWGAGASITFVYDGSYWHVSDSPGIYRGGQCSTAAGTAAKTTNVYNVVIMQGTTVMVPMTYANTTTSVTLNVGSTGAKDVYSSDGARPTTANGKGWIAGQTVEFEFDGANWRLQSNATIIDGGHILTGTIDATKVNVTNLNAGNIASGTMSANYISGGTLTLGGRNNGNGTLTVLDSNGSTIGTWNCLGLYTSGSLATSKKNQTVLTDGGIRFGFSTSMVEGIFDQIGSLQVTDSKNITLENDESNGKLCFRVDGGTSQNEYGVGKAEIVLQHNSSSNNTVATIKAVAVQFNGCTSFRFVENTLPNPTTYTGQSVNQYAVADKLLTFHNGVLTNYKNASFTGKTAIQMDVGDKTLTFQNGILTAEKDRSSSSAASGEFTTKDGKNVVVSNGIITQIT